MKIINRKDRKVKIKDLKDFTKIRLIISKGRPPGMILDWDEQIWLLWDDLALLLSKIEELIKQVIC